MHSDDTKKDITNEKQTSCCGGHTHHGEDNTPSPKSAHTPQTKADELVAKNQRMGLIAFLVVVFMLGLSFASVPLYNLFCAVTGFGGTTQIIGSGGAGLPERVELGRTIKVNFNADISSKMAWDFEPDQRSIEVHPGQQALISYTATNTSDHAITGTALYNVSPPISGGYFYKTQCFCFENQTLQAGETMKFPVTFFIDPDIVNDPDLDDVHTITLSYTFYISRSEDLEKAAKDF